MVLPQRSVRYPRKLRVPGMIEEIRHRFRQHQYEYSLHAADQAILRRIVREEVEQAIQNGTVIEDYPSDKYGPSCLILGYSKDGRPLHIQCTHPARPQVKIITVYEPDPAEWAEFKERRSR